MIASIRSLVESGSGARPVVAAPPSRRKTTWISAIAIAALLVAIALIAKKSIKPSTTTTAAPVTTADNTITADTTTRNPQIRADKVLDLTLRRDSIVVGKRPSIDYAGDGKGFANGDVIQVTNQNVVLNIHCLGFDCADVKVTLGSKAIPPARTGRFKFPLTSISAAGTPVRVLVKGTEAFRITLVRRSFVAR